MSLNRVLWQIQSEIHFLYPMTNYIRDFLLLFHWKSLNDGISYCSNFNFDGKCEIDFVVAVSIPLSQNRSTATMWKIYVSWTSHTFAKLGKTFINHITSHSYSRKWERLRKRERELKECVQEKCPKIQFQIFLTLR